MDVLKISSEQIDLSYKNTIVVSGEGFSSRSVYNLIIETSIGVSETELSLIKNFHNATYSEALDLYSKEPNKYKNWHHQISFPIEMGLFQLVKPECHTGEILLNGYFDPSQQKSPPGFNTIKIKVGRDSYDKEKLYLKSVEDKRLRIDANMSFDIEKFEKYLPHVFHYDYFEEPFSNPELIKNYPNEKFALDENVENEELQKLPQVVAFVIKPSLLGFGKSINLIEKAKKLGKRAVISSTFEGETGHLCLARLAFYSDQYLGSRECHGLGTIAFLSNNLKKLGICEANGSISLTF